ncbi:uncharacterized protein RCC_04474 [Ramularia collo-cygni]|uniref:DUF6590 domain-containing protein n=1 Tax=Ramularia collo-cygni TaxID=112498 RepID=A0A2D3UZH8_9PEZI|nr:uncharacterized protein RCC_04474 [Ramularia collo-cygni]CZT18630.1 uncharacterized protein RCC_04474 [Ramularia collo-cygni]
MAPTQKRNSSSSSRGTRSSPRLAEARRAVAVQQSLEQASLSDPGDDIGPGDAENEEENEEEETPAPNEGNDEFNPVDPADDRPFQFSRAEQRKRGKASRRRSFGSSLAPSAYDPDASTWESGRTPVATGAYRPGAFGWQAPKQESQRSGGVQKSVSSSSKRFFRETRSLTLRKSNPERRKLYSRGTLISLAYHVSNLRRGVKAGDEGVSDTPEGLVYSKRRMAVVVWRFLECMVCVPLYSWGGDGISNKSPDLHREYIEITNATEIADYAQQGVYEPIGAQMRRPLDKVGAVCVAEIFSVRYEDRIEVIGQLTPESADQLMRVMELLMGESNVEEASAAGGS